MIWNWEQLQGREGWAMTNHVGLTKTSAGFCTWHGAALAVHGGWEMRGCGAALGALVDGKLNVSQQEAVPGEV